MPVSVLGVDGYNPSIIQYDQPVGGGASVAPEVTSSSSSSAPATQGAKAATKAVASAPAAPAAPAKRSNTNSSAPSNLSVDQTIDASIQAIANHRTGGREGGRRRRPDGSSTYPQTHQYTLLPHHINTPPPSQPSNTLSHIPSLFFMQPIRVDRHWNYCWHLWKMWSIVLVIWNFDRSTRKAMLSKQNCCRSWDQVHDLIFLLLPHSIPISYIWILPLFVP